MEYIFQLICISIKWQRLSEWTRKKTQLSSINKIHFKYKDTNHLKIKEWKNIYHKHNKCRVYLCIRQNRLQDNVKIEWNFLLKRLIHKDIPIVTNIWGPHKTVSKFLKLKLTELMSKTNISSSVLDNRTRQKKHELKNYVNNLNLMPYN